jgi:hypothetical protein
MSDALLGPDDGPGVDGAALVRPDPELERTGDNRYD